MKGSRRLGKISPYRVYTNIYRGESRYLGTFYARTPGHAQSQARKAGHLNVGRAEPVEAKEDTPPS